MTEKRSNLVNVGRVTGVFGVKGWLKVLSNTEPLENILQYSPWWIKTKHGVKAVEVDDHGVRSGGLTVHFKGVDDRDQAAAYTLTDIAVEREQLPSLETGDYYWFQLIGLKVVSEFEGVQADLGRIKHLIETGANDVIVVEPTPESIDDRERMLPYLPDLYVKCVDLDANKMIVDWDPEF